MATSFPKDKLKVVLLEGIHQSAVDTFKSAGYTNLVHLPSALPQKELIETIKDAHMVGVRSRTHIQGPVLEAAEKLMAIGCFCIGTNQVDLETTKSRGIPTFNAPHSNTRSVAELVIAEIVMLLRGIGDKSRAAHDGKWLKTAENSNEVRGKTLGIIGYGHIGSQVSILAEAFGLRVQYYDIVPKLPMGNAQQVPTLDMLLETSDMVTLHVPATPDTVKMVGANEIAKMKRGSLLLNLSRGNVVDIDALKVALLEGQLRGAGVDVFPVEPASNNHSFESPLRNVPNVVLTPHIGGSTLEAQRNIGVEVASKLIQYSDKGATIGAVNFPNISLTLQDGGHRLLHVHKNQPGILEKINSVLAKNKANIIGQHLQTSGDIGYVVTDIAQEHGANLKSDLLDIPGTIRCRILF